MNFCGCCQSFLFLRGALIELERRSERWCLPVNSSKCESSYFGLILTNRTSRLTSFYSTLFFASIPFQLFLGSHLTALFPFLHIQFHFRPNSSLNSRPCAVSLFPPKDPPKSSYLFYTKLFSGPLLTYVSPGWFLSLKVSNVTKSECCHQVASCAITGFLSLHSFFFSLKGPFFESL